MNVRVLTFILWQQKHRFKAFSGHRMKVAGPAFILWPIQGSRGKQSKGKVEGKAVGRKRKGKGWRKKGRKGGRKEKAGKDKKREAGRKGGEKEGGREMERSG